MRTTIANNGVYHPLTTQLGRTDIQQQEADKALWQARRVQAAKNLLSLTHGREDYLEMADALGLTDVIPEQILAELRGEA